MSTGSDIQAAIDHGYKFLHWSSYDYKLLQCIYSEYRLGSRDKRRYSSAVILADTETSKKDPARVHHNHVVAWTISIRAYGMNLVTLWGHRPDTFAECLEKICQHLRGHFVTVYFHNLAYDWVFLRQFIMARFGTPDRQLNTKPHYPINIQFSSGLILKDSLILSQRSLDKWAKDLQVEHQKAVGKWDYDKIRNQHETFTSDELEYIEHDTLAGVECIDKLRFTLKKHLYAMPYTATGIPREEIRKLGRENRARDRFLRMVLDFDQQVIMEKVFHGGYVHANRYYIDRLVTLAEDGLVQCFDFASSYPFCMLCEKYPCEKFTPVSTKTIQQILDSADDYAYYFKLIMVKPHLKDPHFPMPALQFSKTVQTVNPVLDNGRILCADYAEIYCNEQDLIVLADQYACDNDQMFCVDVMCAAKDYLPQWFRDYVWQLFIAKTKLKGCGDPVLYNISKAKINSCYGVLVQKPCRDVITEIYSDDPKSGKLSGEYGVDMSEYVDEDGHIDLEKYEKYLRKRYKEYVDNHNSILPYQWGVWVTSFAMEHVFELGKCIKSPDDGGVWLYSDTDSAYGIGWDLDKVAAYNQKCKDKLIAAGYGAVEHNGREYWLGVAETDGENDQYTQFKTVGAKRYCGRCRGDRKLHITVAGVPKRGAECLRNNINNFMPGMIFKGEKTGKKMHTYFFNEAYEDDNGNLTGDSIDLSPCDYLLDAVDVVDWQAIFYDDVEIQVYEEE